MDMLLSQQDMMMMKYGLLFRRWEREPKKTSASRQMKCAKRLEVGFHTS